MGYLGEFEQFILFAVVHLGDQAYGGAIRDTIEARTGRVVSAGAINTTLGRLSDRRFVHATVRDASPGRAGRPRKYYRVTPAGARALHDSHSRIQAIAGDVMPAVAALAEEES